VALGLVLPLPLGAAAQAVAGRCSVKFFATSTLHDFEGEAPCALLAIDAPDSQGRYAARAEVEVARLETGISARDKRMREMFEAKRFPRITARFASVDPAELRAGKLPFWITVHGVERPVAPEISAYREAPGENAHFRATFTLSLKQFGLEAPVAMGFIQVADAVEVQVDVDLTTADAEAGP
jgi:polyisoprenoid-binding protein YceI